MKPSVETGLIQGVYGRPIIINTYDIDAAGHVNNVVYLEWAEQLRVEYLMKYFRFREIYEQGFYFVVVSTNISYRKQIKLFEKPSGLIRSRYLTKGLLLIEIEIFSEGKKSASIEQRCVVFDLKAGKMITGKEFETLFEYH
jgi:acyl-CoA thioester hydrolase